MARLLLVSHCPSDNTARLRDAAVSAVQGMDLDRLSLRVLAPTQAQAGDVEWCDGLLLGTTENFGSMAGLSKDFLERIYYPCLESRQGLPLAMYIRAGQDGRGTRTQLEKITTGLRWRLVSEILILRGEFQPAFERQVSELAMTLAAGLDAGIF